MTIAGELEYAYARLSARFGQRPDEIAWRSIEPIRELSSLLDAARGLPFKQWLVGITAEADCHRIEAALLAQSRALVAEVARWMPACWQPAVEWAGVLAELPAIEHLSRGGDALPWMREDPLYAPLCDDVTRPPTVGPFAQLAAGWQRPDGLYSSWRKEWARRLPSNAFATSPVFGAFAKILETHRAATSNVLLAHAPVARVTDIRSALAARLALLFRRATLDPAAGFIFLALSALDLERLRGELLRRVFFPTLKIAA